MNAPIAEFSDYEGLRRALMACREKRNISFETMDDIAGAPRGYFSKLLGNKALKRIGLQSLGWAMGGLGVKGIVIEDPEALRLVQTRFVSRDQPHLESVMRGVTTQITLSKRHMSIIQAKGRRNRWSNMTEKQKQNWGKRMAKSRWKKEKMRARQRKAAHKARKS